MRGLKRQYTIHLGRQCTLALSGWRRQNGPGTAHLQVTNRPAQLQTGRPFRAHSPRRTRSMRDTARRGSRSVRPRESVRYVRSHAPRTCSSNRSASVCHPGPRLHSNAPGGSGALITRLLGCVPQWPQLPRGKGVAWVVGAPHLSRRGASTGRCGPAASRGAGIPGGGCSPARRRRAVARAVEVRWGASGGRGWREGAPRGGRRG